MGALIRELLETGAPDAPAIGAPGRQALDHGGLRDLADRTAGWLDSAGIGRGDRVALVLPNGPEMASAFVAFATGATTAPLNPASRAAEFRFHLEDLGARMLVVGKDSTSEAVAVARDLGMGIAELAAPGHAPAGRFELAMVQEPPESGARRTGRAEPDDIALVLHTSGTTSRPKIVPLSQRNVCASAGHIVASLALEATDRCLNIMPLFHIHGLIAAVLSSLAAGASVHCTPGFNALKVFLWLRETAPSWFTAVPTMHQAILARAPRNRDAVAALDLRLVRSSSSSLPPRVMREMEKTFRCPVIESYGMTEAAHQMTSSPLPPAPRYPGSVGLAAGPEVAIMAEDGDRLLPAGEIGEVVIRGPNVTAGYEGNPGANATAFTGGWFRTGDQGTLDDAGYLRLTGRLKEIINRGGEKISPREVDEVMMDHPAVEQAVTFAIPHAELGEDIAVAVVPGPDADIDEQTLRDFAADRLARFKIPRKVLFMDEIPKGATGKLQRIGLAERLGLS